MARPKSDRPPMEHLTLTVTPQTRAELRYIANHDGCSISALIARWASDQARKTAKQTKTAYPEPPDLDQITMLKGGE